MTKRLGLSLSGGGYRAAAFHLGTLRKLNQLGILTKVDVLSTISGGSIVGAAWCMYRGDYDSFHAQMIQDLKTKSVRTAIYCSWVFVRSILLVVLLVGGALVLPFTRWPGYTFLPIILFLILAYHFQFTIFPVSRVIENAYDRYFFFGKTLSELKSVPVLAIGSSNLHTGRPFTFSQTKMSDSAYVFKKEIDPPIYFTHQNFPIARAVMASSCVPFAFTPVRIDKEFFLNSDDFGRIKPVLVDGGVYDNQGIQKITQANSSYQCDVIITSDAGGNFMLDGKYPNTISLLKRTVDLFMYRIKAAQMITNLYSNGHENKRPIAYFSLGWRIDNAIPGFIGNLIEGQISPDILNAHRLPAEWVTSPKLFKDQITERLRLNTGFVEIKKRDLTDAEWELARSVATDLKCLSEVEIQHLIRQAENLTELQIKLYCPDLINNRI